MSKKDTAWLGKLQVGDNVAYLNGTHSRVHWVTSTVEKITPSGRINLDCGLTVNPDGKFRGDRYNGIYPMTGEIRESIDKRNLMMQINNRLLKVDFTQATWEQLKDVYKLLIEIPEKPSL